VLWLVCAYKRIQTWRLRLEVFLGLCTLSSKKANQRDVVIRCWCHEIQRVHLSWLFSLDGGCQKFTSIAWSEVKLHRFLCQAKNARSLVIGWLTTRIRSGWRRKSSETWLKTSAAWSVYMIYVVRNFELGMTFVWSLGQAIWKTASRSYTSHEPSWRCGTSIILDKTNWSWGPSMFANGSSLHPSSIKTLKTKPDDCGSQRRQLCNYACTRYHIFEGWVHGMYLMHAVSSCCD